MAVRRDGRVVDGGGLENHCTRKGAGGSNPSPSARIKSLHNKDSLRLGVGRIYGRTRVKAIVRRFGAVRWVQVPGTVSADALTSIQAGAISVEIVASTRSTGGCSDWRPASTM